MTTPHDNLSPPAGLMQPALILASTSKYRKELLTRLSITFTCIAPQVDETPRLSETPYQLALRLAQEKALAVAQLYPNAVVIGADQVADLSGQALGKPGDHARAISQLQQMRGQWVVFQTALAVAHQGGASLQAEVAAVRVKFRDLSDAEIERYLRLETPYDCAGSAKSEGLGISLLERIDNDDPTALIGLPLIRTCHMLRQAGLAVP